MCSPFFLFAENFIGAGWVGVLISWLQKAHIFLWRSFLRLETWDYCLKKIKLDPKDGGLGKRLVRMGYRWVPKKEPQQRNSYLGVLQGGPLADRYKWSYGASINGRKINGFGLGLYPP